MRIASDRVVTLEDVSAWLMAARARGVRVWEEDGAVLLAPRARVEPGDVDFARRHRGLVVEALVVEALRAVSTVEPDAGRDVIGENAPWVGDRRYTGPTAYLDFIGVKVTPNSPRERRRHVQDGVRWRPAGEFDPDAEVEPQEFALRASGPRYLRNDD